MLEFSTKTKTCLVVGASQAGVTFAFALRAEGWEGEIVLYDQDQMLPYYRPPLSKAALTGTESIEDNLLMSAHLYEKERISLELGVSVVAIDKLKKNITLKGGRSQLFDKLVLATGSRAIIPQISGINKAKNLFTLRTAKDVKVIQDAFAESKEKRIVIIGGGYIGLETAASLKKMGAKVCVLEREARVLSRVTAPEVSEFFQELHAQNDVAIFTGKNITSIENQDGMNKIVCDDGSCFEADIIIVGVGVSVNRELAEGAGLEIENGIRVDESTCTNDENIYAIGDCTNHFNKHYGRFVRLESVQNANDQAKVAAAAICGKDAVYNSLPWFWSDQYNVKLQMVGLSAGYNHAIIRKETGVGTRLSVWYFKDDVLLAVDAVNNTKAYVMGTKFIKGGNKIDKLNLANPEIDLKPATLLVK